MTRPGTRTPPHLAFDPRRPWRGLVLAAVGLAIVACGPGGAPDPGPDGVPDPAEGLQIRVGIDRAVYAPGDPIRVRIEVVNRLDIPRTLAFRDGQRVDAVIEDEEGVEVLRWSRDQLFTQALGEELLEPGEEGRSWEVEVYAPATPGSYRLRGILTGSDVVLEAGVPVQVTVDGDLDEGWDTSEG